MPATEIFFKIVEGIHPKFRTPGAQRDFFKAFWPV